MRLLYLFFPLLFSACTTTSQWKLNNLSGAGAQFHSVKLKHKSSDLIRGLELEFLRLHDKIFAYINVYSQTVPSSTTPDCASVTLHMGGEVYEDVAKKLEGGQRLLLKEDMAEKIITALSKGQSVTIILNGYEEVITPESFIPNFQKLADKLPLGKKLANRE